MKAELEEAEAIAAAQLAQMRADNEESGEEEVEEHEREEEEEEEDFGTFVNKRVRFGDGGMALECPGGGICSPGERARIWGSTSSRWSYDPSRRLQSHGSGVCLEAQEDGKVYAKTCTGEPKQKWFKEAYAGPGISVGKLQFRNDARNECLNVEKGRGVQGASAFVWKCGDSGVGWNVDDGDIDIDIDEGTVIQSGILTSGATNHGDRVTRGVLTLVMQTDGNLVLYGDKNAALWESGTSKKGTAPYRAIMQPDGNFIVYDSGNAPLWHTETYGKGVAPYRATVQSDGNFVVYDANNAALWASGTHI
jgi:hypothetical protein